MADVASIQMFLSPEYWNQSHTVAAHWREQTPVHLSMLADETRVWVTTRFHDARRLLKDARLSKDSEQLKAIIRRQRRAAGQPTDVSGMFSPHMLFRDGEPHRRLRTKVQRHLSKEWIQRMQPRVERLVDDLLAELPTDCPIDLIERFAAPLPEAVSSELLGIPERELPALRGWTAALMEERTDRTIPASEALERYNARLLAAKRAQPADDLLSTLVTEEDPLTDEELMGTTFLLMVASHETTTNAIGNSVGALLARPQLWHRLTREPELVPQAVEELLRYDPPVRMGTHRYTVQPVQVGVSRSPPERSSSCQSRAPTATLASLPAPTRSIWTGRTPRPT